MKPYIQSIQVGLPVALITPNPLDERASEWRSGIQKSAVSGPVWAGRTNLAGDGQGDLNAHGGVDKAVYGYPREHYPAWQSELELESLPPAAFGENLTTAGLLESELCIGDSLRAGKVVLQVSQPRGPCWKLARVLGVKDMILRMNANGRCGFYLRVLEEGWLEAGMEVELLERPNPGWTVLRAHRLLQDARSDPAAARALLALPHFAERSRIKLQKLVDQL